MRVRWWWCCGRGRLPCRARRPGPRLISDLLLLPHPAAAAQLGLGADLVGDLGHDGHILDDLLGELHRFHRRDLGDANDIHHGFDPIIRPCDDIRGDPRHSVVHRDARRDVGGRVGHVHVGDLERPRTT
ncbi:hypothetical protein T484DRAFT_1927437 [Baffinella frigidus]|nr:hypothetical protein T484DRAFT_1927437 [Cryptophyta sp. CCMP2293]